MNEAGQGFALRTYLFGEQAHGDNDSIDTIARSLRERGPARTATYGIERLGTGALAVLDREVAGIVDGILEDDLGTLLIDGWSTWPLPSSACVA